MSISHLINMIHTVSVFHVANGFIENVCM